MDELTRILESKASTQEVNLELQAVGMKIGEIEREMHKKVT